MRQGEVSGIRVSSLSAATSPLGMLDRVSLSVSNLPTRYGDSLALIPLAVAKALFLSSGVHHCC